MFDSLSACAQTISLEFKDIELGKASREAVLTKYPGATVYQASSHEYRIKVDYRNHSIPICGSLRALNTDSCLTTAETSNLFRIGNTSLGNFLFIEIDGIVEEVLAEFSTESHEAVLSAIEMKYGQPSQRADIAFKNLAGATLENIKSKWIVNLGEIVVIQRLSDASKMQLRITSKRRLKDLKDDSNRILSQGTKHF